MIEKKWIGFMIGHSKGVRVVTSNGLVANLFL